MKANNNAGNKGQCMRLGTGGPFGRTGPMKIIVREVAKEVAWTDIVLTVVRRTTQFTHTGIYMGDFHLGANVAKAESDPGFMTSVPVYSSKDAAKGEKIQLSKV